MKVLVIEDEQAIQSVLEEVLTEAGFEVAIATSGEQAISLLEEGIYRAVVTDIRLPGKLSGWEIGRAVREIDATFPVVYMSGSHAEEWASKGVPNSLMLAKPFAPA